MLFRPDAARLFLPPSRNRIAAGMALALLGPWVAVFVAERAAFARFVGLPFLVAIVLATLIGRLSSGVVCVVASAALMDYYVIPPTHTFNPSGATDYVALGTFSVVAVGIGLVLTRFESMGSEHAAANERLSLLARVGDELVSSSLEYRSAMQRLAEVLVPTLGSQCVIHTLEDPPIEETIAVSAPDAQKASLLRELLAGYPSGPGGEGIVARVMRTGQTEILNSVSDAMLKAAAQDEQHLGVLRTLGVRSAVVTPMIAQGRTLGTLSLSAADPGSYSTDVVTFIEEIADRGALALANARLYMEAEAARARVSLVAGVSELLAEELKYPAAFDRLAGLLAGRLADLVLIDALTEDCRLDRVVARHADPAKQPLADRLRDEYPPSLEGEHPVVHVIRSGAPEFAGEMSPELLRRMTRDEHHLQLVTELGFCSFMCVPLRARGRMLGTLTMISTTPSHRYGSEDLQVGMEIARRAAVRIDNARLYERQRKIATTLQASLLPKSLPEIKGIEIGTSYWAAGEGYEVGGDFYDVIQDEPDSCVALIGDVCGKGAEAAALVGVLRHAARALAAQHLRPSTLLHNLNEVLLEQETEGRFCTMCVAKIRTDGQTRSLTVATAGHPRPFLVRADGTVLELPTRGTLLGVYEVISTEPYSSELGPGDTLVMYTDGVTERPNGDVSAQRDVAGLLAGAEACSVPELLARIETDITPGSLLDDAAIVVLRITPSIR
ncbi:MAG: SpoIIE family protein phosphatase [Actinomycetota bacterium]|nr:SpoIIE family protein phosphatase [Actinomycetota bacterium]